MKKLSFELVQELNIKNEKKSLSAQQKYAGFTICLDIESNLADLP